VPQVTNTVGTLINAFQMAKIVITGSLLRWNQNTPVNQDMYIVNLTVFAFLKMQSVMDHQAMA